MESEKITETQENKDDTVGAVPRSKEKEVICKIAEILRPVVRK